MEDKRPKIFFRADGDLRLGLGHLIRSIALADMLGRRFACHFLIRAPLPFVERMLAERGFPLHELPAETDDMAEAAMISSDWLTGREIAVLDGYHFDTAYQERIRSGGSRLVCIDDVHAFPFVADAVINHAPGAAAQQYRVAPHPRLCLGLDYALLRRPFLEAARRRRVIGERRNVFICFGGADAHDLTGRVLRAVLQVNRFERIVVVIGAAYPHLDALKELAGKDPRVAIRQNLAAEALAGVMEDCQLAVVPASSILFEVLAVRMPVISGYYVDNQKEGYRGFRDMGLIYGVGDFLHVEDLGAVIEQVAGADPMAMIRRQAAAIDGRSPEHLLKVFGQLYEGIY